MESMALIFGLVLDVLVAFISIFQDVRMKDAFEGTFMSQIELDPLNLQRSLDIGLNRSPELSPTSHCLKLAKNLGINPDRRSLVGSFEESLLSGWLLSGKFSQRIDGFLAVLNITGGSFSPPSQKLPFVVTSVDGDSSLLYYASIDLAGRLASSKGKSPKLKRSLSNEESRAAKSRMRVPVKGRIQLVLSNPEMTPVHTFLCNYDLSDMPAGTKEQVGQARENRKMVKMMHTAGIKSYAKRRAEYKAKHGKEMDQIELFIDCHTKNTDIITELNNKKNAIPEEERSHESLDQIYEAIVGPGSGDRVNGYGMGVTKSLLRGTARSSSSTQVIELEKTIDSLKESLEAQAAAHARALEEQAMSHARAIEEQTRVQEKLHASLEDLKSMFFMMAGKIQAGSK